jgi:hypothetical protein
MTQDILSSMSSDEVNSISDNSESLQIATIIKQKYFDIVNRLDLPTNQQLIQLLPSTDPTIPVVMYVPDGVSDIKWVKYFDSNPLDGNTTDDFAHDLNTDITNTLTNPGSVPPGYLYVTVLPNDEFIDYVTAFTTQDANVESYTLSDKSNGFNGNFVFNYKNDQQPIYCTIISNYYVLFDAFDSSIDDTLQANKTMMCGTIIPKWQMTDTFIPDLDEEQFPLLLNEAKSLAWLELKQQPHPLAAQETRRGWSTIQKKKAVINRPTFFDELPGFGRKRGYYGFRGGYYTGFNEYNQRGGLY